jgi:hypothetical protein
VKARAWAILGVHGELLAQRKLDDGLFLATPEEGEGTSKQGDRESGQRPHDGRDSERIHEAE